MIANHAGFMIESIDELPPIPSSIDTLYPDFETTSGHDKKKSINPWKHCSILGFNWTFDDHEYAYYVPLQHRDGKYNLPIHECLGYLSDLFKAPKRIVGHNLKYDVHVAINAGGVAPQVFYDRELIDTRTIAKIINSDRLSYDMDSLSRDWLKENIKAYADALKKYTHTSSGNWKIHDYGVIPADVMAPYACQDCHTTRKIYYYCKEFLPEECQNVWDAEVALTKELIKIERKGLRLDIKRVIKDGYTRVPELLRNIELTLKRLTGQIFRPNVNSDCYDILCILYGLPVLEMTKGGKNKLPEPSFGADALKRYMMFKVDDPVIYRVISLISRFRKWHKIQSSFLLTYMELCKKHGDKDIRLHTDYNQCVSTGRMASAKPNTQQLSPAAKWYILPDEDCVLVDFDLKQIEYRCIADLIEDPRIIEEYQTNPKADFHDSTAKLCQIDRQSAKTMNFGVSFGAGEKKTILMYRKAVDPADVPEGEVFEKYCDRQGKATYQVYHKTLPTLKTTKAAASAVLKRRGFVRNKFGRRRYLPIKMHYAAFNTAVQSWAADIMKRITLRVQELLRPVEDQIYIVALVHDSWVINCPKDMVDEWVPKIKQTIEETDSKMCVPMLVNYAMSDENWSKCK